MSGIDVGQGITVEPGKFVKKNKHRALNKCRAWTKCANLCYKNPIKLENICRPLEKFQKIINVGPWISVGHEQNVQIYVTKNPLNLKISVDPGKNSKI